MKNLFYYLLLLVAIACVGAGCTSTTYVAQTPVDQPVTYQTFYDNLSPYGNWIDYPGYGHVWNPRAEMGFRPYASNGQWRYSNDGWAWQSNYNWGWAPFHYGRWLYDDNYGWLWVPGYDWSPAWVTWGRVDNYYAWAPITPEVNIGVQYNNWRPHGAYWNVVPREHIGDRNITNVIVQNNNTTIINNNNTNITKNITIINNYNTSRTNNYYAKGPDVHEVEKYTNQRITPVSFKEVNQFHKPAQQSNVMEIYRPVVQNPHAQNEGRNLQHNDAERPGDNGNHLPVNQQSQGNNNNITHDQNIQSRPNKQKPDNIPAAVNANNAPITLQKNNNINNSDVQKQDLQHRQNQPVTQPVQNTSPVENTPQPQRVDQYRLQPHKFRTVDPVQTRPIREDGQVPSVQPSQQRKNVQQLPVQRAPQGNNNNLNQRPGERQN